ncbi:MAG: CDP-alcohol phosphatidyltransferase family protein [Myxococcales bacterium]|nr:CDP-alcohol phosphatidyltransferase family protein [Myxococcales bacterium]
MGSILCSFLAILRLLNEPHPTTVATSCMLIVFASVLDVLDGWVARWLGRSSMVGAQLDSFADLIGFGVAPAIIVWTGCIYQLGTFGFLLTGGYVLATALRLARFNVEGSGHNWAFPGRVRGLTTTMSGTTLVTLVWAYQERFNSSAGHLPLALLAGVTCIFACLQISNLPFRTLKSRGRDYLRGGLVVVIMSGLWFTPAHPAYLLCFCGMSYVTLGTIDAAVLHLLHSPPKLIVIPHHHSVPRHQSNLVRSPSDLKTELRPLPFYPSKSEVD